MIASHLKDSVNTLLDQLAAGAADFEDVIALINEHFEYTPSRFRNGAQDNPAGTNEGSCRLFAFARQMGLDEAQTLRCFGRHYQAVQAHPDGTDHANIREFMRQGWSGVHFEQAPLRLRDAH